MQSSFSFQASDFTASGGVFDEARLHSEISQAPGILVALEAVDRTASGSCLVEFRAELPLGQEAILTALIQAHTGEPLARPPAAVTIQGLKTTADHKLQVSLWPTEGSRVNLVSHNWCDATSWYSDSQLVTEEVPTPREGGGYALAHSPVIDVTHGKVFEEDFLRDGAGQTYGPRVTLGGAALQEDDPDGAPGNADWRLDYATGVLTLTRTDLTPEEAATLRVTYRYARGSHWDLVALPGKILRLRRVEVQFTEDVSFRDTVEFSVWAYAAVGAPHLVASGALAPTDLVPVSQPVRYKGMRDIVNEANGGYPAAQPSSHPNPTWRDLLVPVTTFPWDYQATVDLKGDWGTRVRVRLLNDRPFGGTFGTVTFYALSEASS